MAFPIPPLCYASCPCHDPCTILLLLSYSYRPVPPFSTFDVSSVPKPPGSIGLQVVASIYPVAGSGSFFVLLVLIEWMKNMGMY